MKKLHLFIIRSYISPFILTFFVVLFILLMQFLWKYVDDLVGKGLEWYIIAELLWYTSASLVPMALPLAILLSSIMTFGNLGEQYELVALKSSGLSLQRIMRPLIIIVTLTSILAFYFSNNILPIANLKMGSLLWDVRQQKPALNIKPGVYYSGIEGYSIKVKKKNAKNNELEGITIYDHTSRLGNNKLITAKSGSMLLTEDERYLILTLYDGYSYEEIQPYPIKTRKGMNFHRLAFKEQKIRFDLTSFSLTRTDEELFKDHEQMLNLSQLQSAEDTLILKLAERIEMIGPSIKRRYLFGNFPELLDSLPDSNNVEGISNNLFAEEGLGIPFATDKEDEIKIINNAADISRNIKVYLSVSKNDLAAKRISIIRHRIERHRKFTLSIACVLLFFVGAPLGAIIRKGGLGMPVVMSVVFFLIYHVVSIIGEKTVKESVIEPWQGMWMASAIFLPLGIFLTYKATTDSVLFDIDTYIRILTPWRKK